MSLVRSASLKRIDTEDTKDTEEFHIWGSE